MYLKSLEISGFKSFGKKSVLNFSSPITGIVGPNGSGKSNVAESFRFVLGEQSMKSMRGKKSEDLIWNGGGGEGRANRASVKLIFDNTKRFLNIDFDEVAIERVVFRDSSSEYYINGSAVRLKDIIELLAGAHIGASSHHIISQGEADRILNASVKERRVMIEDALGLKIYQYKREESERKLEKTEENIRQVESLRKEIAPHLRFLKKQVEKIEKTLEMKEELKGLYRNYLKREDAYIKHMKASLEADKKAPEEEIERLASDLNEARRVLEASKQKDSKSDAVILIEKEISETRGAKDALMRDIGRLEGEIASAERMVQKRKEHNERQEHVTVPIGEVEAFAESVNRDIEDAEKSGDLSRIQSVLKAVKNSIRSFIEKIRSGVERMDTKAEEAEIANLKERKEGLSVDLSAVAEKSRGLEEKYAALREEIDREKDTGRDAEKALFRIIARQNEVRAILDVISAKLQTLRVVEEDFKRELQEGGILIGRSVFEYETSEINNSEGGVSNIQDVIVEDRAKQEERRRVIERIKIRLEDAGGLGGDEVMREFKEVSERDVYLEKELEDLHKSSASLKDLIKELGERLDVEFKTGIQKINQEFETFFGLMFGGGHASLSVVREEKRKPRLDTELMGADDATILENMESNEKPEEGVDIHITIPRKKIKSLMMLSGGERALTSIALLFAMSQVNPPPFLILDETDAALDEANSRKYGDMIENLSKYSQLILITHNRETMSRAGVIYGVTMDKTGLSKLLSIAFDEAVSVAK